KFSFDYIQKKYDLGSQGEKMIGSFSYDRISGQLSGFYGGFPFYLVNQKGEKKKVFQAIDLLTHPNYRKKGLFLWNADNTAEQANKLGIEMFFAFPNANSYHGFFNKIELNKIGRWQTYEMKISGLNIYSLCHKFGLFTPVYNFFWKYIVSKFRLNHEDWTILSSLYRKRLTDEFSVDASVEYLKYKESYSEANWIKYKDIFIFLKKDDGISIGDLLVVNPKVEIESNLHNLGKMLRVKNIRITASNSHPLTNLLSHYNNFIKKEGGEIGIKFLPNNNVPFNVAFTISDSDDF
ncbi:MAG: hypothetical protein RIT43_1596, partial [Bacteroidota bacterium]